MKPNICFFKLSLAGILFGTFVWALCVSGEARGDMFFENGFTMNVPEPRLLSPVSEEVVLTGKPSLEFKWSPFEGSLFNRRFYDFRLYKGYEQIASTLIYKEKVSPQTYSVVLKADLFEDGQVYTWTLRQVYDIDKSDAVYNSFKVTKK